MDAETRVAVVDHVRRHLETGRVHSMHITWYGGEPLLPRSFEALEWITAKVLALCAANGVAYSANIITNGYLLDERAARRLAACRVDLAQVTLDGPPRTHDTTRALRGGRPTFARILENLRTVRKHLRVSIRMNVSEDNAGAVAELKRLLRAEGILDDAGRTAFYISPVRSYTESCGAGGCLTDAAFHRLQLQLLREGINADGFTVVEDYPQPKETVCTATSEGSLVIGPDGLTYKCWLDIGRPELAVGHIAAQPEQAEKARRWTGYSPFGQARCSGCSLLPLCLGGCPALNMDPETRDSACCQWRFTLAEHLAYLAGT